MAYQQEQFAVILPAAGQSVRFGMGRSKLLEDLGGEPVLRRSVRAFLQRPDVAALIIATPSASTDALRLALGELREDARVRFCAGGASRAESVRNALTEAPGHAPWLAVHDAARPLVSQELIARAFDAARRYGAAVPALPVALTIKEAQGPLPAKVLRTVPRQRLWAMQTPQVMRRDALEAAYLKCPLPLSEVTDDVQLLELAGQEVWLVEGEERNLKITTPADLRVAGLTLDEGDGPA
jgi:2-C-methyl-D-erythritol 4-phosphate cytidylyltransferase